jgi:hypothetical protein
MPSVIAIEAKPVEFRGIETGYFHLYLVKTVTDAKGRVLSEKVIRGTAGADGDLETLANVDLASSPDRRGSDTPQERHRTPLNLGTRNAEDVWQIMVQHAVNIENADLRYSPDIFQDFSGGDLNSNSVVASVLYSASIKWTQVLPIGLSRSDAPLYGQLQYMKVDDALVGTKNRDVIRGGVGSDRIEGRGQNDTLYGDDGKDYLYGGLGKDALRGGDGDDRLYGEAGADNLLGGLGKDVFFYNALANGSTEIDRIQDFSVADDTLWLNNSGFKGLGREGQLQASAFWTGAKAHDANDRVVYDRSHGVLFYDPDGTGPAEQVVMAKLSAGLKMTSLDILVV